MMNKSQILKKIGNIIDELSEQQQYLASTNKINLLELELFTANADFLIDHIEILKKLNDKTFELEAHDKFFMQPEPVKVEKLEPEDHQQLADIPAEEEGKKKFNFSFDEEPTEMIFDFEKKIAVEEVFDRPLSDDERRLLEEKSTAPDAKPEEFIILDDHSEEDNPEQEDDIEPYLISDREKPIEKPAPQNPLANAQEEKKPAFTEEKTQEQPKEQPHQNEVISPEPVLIKETAPTANPLKPNDVAKPEPTAVKEERPLTLNEMLSAKLSQANPTNGNRQGKKLEDLKAAISINDKMVFIKELFNGYNLAYSEAIEIVNRFESFDAADNFLQKNYAVKNDWESKKVTVTRFYDYLHKKFVM